MQLLASGGVDSTVCAALLSKVVPKDKLIVLHIDNGFMRKNESQEVVKSLSKLGLNVIRKLKGESAPREITVLLAGVTERFLVCR